MKPDWCKATDETIKQLEIEQTALFLKIENQILDNMLMKISPRFTIGINDEERK